MNNLRVIDRLMLLELSRRTLDAAVRLRLPESRLWAHFCESSWGGAPVFFEEGSVFVTLRKQGRLRGCIGTVGVPQPLGESTVANSAAAALRDPRFEPVQQSDLPEIRVELTLLGSLQEMESPQQLVIGEHGILVSLGYSRGLLLPQVAEELDLTPETFLALGCRKAGLSPGAWTQGARVQFFSARHFGA